MIFPSFCFLNLSPSLFPPITHALSVHEQCLVWQGPRIADDVTQELCGSYEYGHFPQSMLGEAVIQATKLWKSFAY